MSVRRAGALTRVAVCGEVRSGKSTVVNTLLRDRILPDNVGAETRPEVVVRWRAAAGVDVVFPGGAERIARRVEGPDALRGAARIAVWSSRRHLRGVELVEVPLTTAEALTEAQIDAVAAADVMIWVTIASQAWRLTERKILDELAEVRPPHTLLAISRGDKLRSDADRDKIMARVRHETAAYAEDCVFVQGARHDLERAGRSRAAWERTGGATLAAQIGACRTALAAEHRSAA